MTTKISCGVINDTCVDELKSAFVYLFDSNASRDTHFAAVPEQLVNDGNRSSMAFVGTQSLSYQFWDGADRPSTYDNTHWKNIPIATAIEADTHYWGDSNADLSVRARLDPATGFLIFERRIGGTWVEKFRISDSVTTDSIKLFESLNMPTVDVNELGLYAALLKDGENNNVQILRPVFMDHNHEHFMVVAAAPDGTLRIPQNVDAALNDPMNVPLVYKRVVLEDQGEVMRNALTKLTGDDRLDANALKNLPSGGTSETATSIRDKLTTLTSVERLDASAVKNIPASDTGVQVRDKLDALTGDDRLDASAVKNIPTSTMSGGQIVTALEYLSDGDRLEASAIQNLTRTHYQESDNQILIDPVNLTYIELGFTGTSSITQTMPNIVNCRDDARLMIRNLKTNGAIVTLVPSNSGQKVDGTSSLDVDPGVSVLFVCIKSDNEWHKVIDSEQGGSTTVTGIEFDNGTANIAGITKVNVPTSEILNKGGGEIDLTPYTTYRNEPSSQYDNLSHQLVVQPPLKTFSDPDVQGGGKLYIDPGAYESMHKPSFLAYISEDTVVVGKLPTSEANTDKSHHDGAIWFDDIVWPSGPYIQTDRVTKTYGLQEADMLDPNVTGGTDYLVAFRVHLKGTAPGDGNVRLYLYNKSLDPFEPTGYLRDINDNPLTIQRSYKSGEELGVLDLIGVINAKGLQQFTCHAVDTFTDDQLMLTDRTEGATGLMIQALTSESKSGIGLLQFENDTQQNIEFSSHYLGEDRMDLAYINSKPETPVTYTANTNFGSVNGYRLINPNGLKVGVVSGHTHIEDDGVNICDFNFGRIFSAEETIMLRGKNIDVTTTLVDKDAGFEVALMKWTGAPDTFTSGIIASRSNGTPVLEANWSKVDSLFISEDAVAGDHTVAKTFTIPVDANNYAIIIYPAQAQTPLVLRLKELKVDVNPAFTSYILHASELAGEQHLLISDEYKKYVVDNLYYYSFRYTLTDTAGGTPMPVGKSVQGKADISLDQTVAQVNGSANHTYEGALKFGKDGTATISTDLIVQSDQLDSVTSQVKFWWATVSPDGSTFTKIDASLLTMSVKGKSKASYKMPTFRLEVETDDRIVLLAESDIVDGAYIMSKSPSEHMVSTAIHFEELVAVSSDVPGTGIDLSVFNKVFSVQDVAAYQFVNVQQFTIDVTIPDGVEMAVLGAYAQVDATTIKPIPKVEYRYTHPSVVDGVGQLIFDLGSTYTGEIIIGFYA
jgi:hypothetical protein